MHQMRGCQVAEYPFICIMLLIIQIFNSTDNIPLFFIYLGCYDFTFVYYNGLLLQTGFCDYPYIHVIIWHRRQPSGKFDESKNF